MTVETKQKVEEIISDVEENVTEEIGEDDALDAKNPSRNEKKAKKMLLKLGLKPLSDIVRVTIKRSRNVVFAMSTPDVYVNSTGDSFVVFGEAKVEDLGAQAAAATRAIRENMQATTQKAANETKSEESSEPVNEEGLEAKDIEMVMNQAGVSRAKAVKALKDNKNDLVNAIMELTM